ncbi:uncharacterized protein LOC101852411 [Aplysia californica]|uniref:Uncharacterized protein LOC101852411 n=1 Tax=Aplysia californica TaxID=6500 RepID=A0ABM1A0S9_APLCA|nr:uncharacterized protein LOC101852411 [Aplysia californica]
MYENLNTRAVTPESTMDSLSGSRTSSLSSFHIPKGSYCATKLNFQTQHGRHFLLAILLSVGFVPVLTLLIQNLIRVSAASKTLTLNNEALAIVEAALGVKEVIYSLQLERGYSSLYASSGGDIEVRNAMLSQRMHVDDTLLGLSLWPGESQVGNTTRMSSLRAQRESLIRFRHDIDVSNSGEYDIVDYFSGDISVFLAFMGTLVRSVGVAGAIWPRIVAFISLSHSTEEAGQERAKGAIFFSTGPGRCLTNKAIPKGRIGYQQTVVGESIKEWVLASSDEQREATRLSSTLLVMEFVSFPIFTLLTIRLIAALLKGQEIPPEEYPSATVCFSGIWGFERLSRQSSGASIIYFINRLFDIMDDEITRHDVFKVETVALCVHLSSSARDLLVHTGTHLVTPRGKINIKGWKMLVVKSTEVAQRSARLHMVTVKMMVKVKKKVMVKVKVNYQMCISPCFPHK